MLLLRCSGNFRSGRGGPLRERSWKGMSPILPPPFPLSLSTSSFSFPGTISCANWLHHTLPDQTLCRIKQAQIMGLSNCGRTPVRQEGPNRPSLLCQLVTQVFSSSEGKPRNAGRGLGVRREAFDPSPEELTGLQDVEKEIMGRWRKGPRGQRVGARLSVAGWLDRLGSLGQLSFADVHIDLKTFCSSMEPNVSVNWASLRADSLCAVNGCQQVCAGWSSVTGHTS